MVGPAMTAKAPHGRVIVRETLAAGLEARLLTSGYVRRRGAFVRQRGLLEERLRLRVRTPSDGAVRELRVELDVGRPSGSRQVLGMVRATIDAHFDPGDLAVGLTELLETKLLPLLRDASPEAHARALERRATTLREAVALWRAVGNDAEAERCRVEWERHAVWLDDDRPV